MIGSICVRNEGYVHCESIFYSVNDILSNHSSYTFSPGINKLIGDVDSGNWAVSYLLSMYKWRPKDFILFAQPNVTVDGKVVSLCELSALTCYMDRSDPLFSGSSSVEKLIMRGLKQSKLNCTWSDVQELFHLDDERIKRPLAGVGNEVFRAMAAIGFSRKKEIFCFPWLSQRRFEGYHENLASLLQILKDLGKIFFKPEFPKPLN